MTKPVELNINTAQCLIAFTRAYKSGSLSLSQTNKVFERHLDRISVDQEKLRNASAAIQLQGSPKTEPENLQNGISHHVFEEAIHPDAEESIPFKTETPEVQVTTPYKEAAKKIKDHAGGLVEKLDNAEGKKEVISQIKRDAKLLMEMREICLLSIAAKQNYYDHDLMGMISALFQKMAHALGFQTPIEKAQQILLQCDLALQTQFDDNILKTIDLSLVDFTEGLKSNKFQSEAQLQSLVGIMRQCAIGQRRNLHTYFKASPASREASHLLIAQKSGDVIAIKIDGHPKRSGGTRRVYEAVLHSHGKKPQNIAVVTAAFLNTFVEVTAPPKDIQATNENIRHELAILQHLKGIDGIINTHNCMTLEINGTSFVFAAMDYFPLGNLENFLETPEGKKLTPEQKIHLIDSLENTVKKIHEKGYLHRDIKLANIVVKYNPNNPVAKMYEPVLIDFADSCSKKQDTRNIVGTAEYWPHEYLEASATGGKVPMDVPPESFDLWALGLICYRIWDGKEGLLQKLGYRRPPGFDDTKKCNPLLASLTDINKGFPMQLSDTDKRIREMLQPAPIKSQDGSVLEQRLDGIQITTAALSDKMPYLIPRGASPIASGQRWEAFEIDRVNAQMKKERCVVLRSKPDADVLKSQQLRHEDAKRMQSERRYLEGLKGLSIDNVSVFPKEAGTYAVMRSILPGRGISSHDQVQQFIAAMERNA